MLPCLHGRARVAPSETVPTTPSSPGPGARDLSSFLYSHSDPCPSMSSSETDADPVRRKSLGLLGSLLTPHYGDYEVYQSIGVGCAGTASILISQHKPSRNFVVVRHIDLEPLSFQQLGEVQHEIKISQLLHHQNIACYLISFVVDAHLWAVQPLMHYGSCADIMHSAEPFKNGFQESVVAVILKDVALGLQYLHSLGFVHRSVRAKHFLIHENGQVKLSGLRSVVSMMKDGSRMKSLHGHFPHTVDNICWLAPEVLAQDLSGYSFKSDTYSVGIAALELSTGEAPFAGLPVTEIMMLKLRGHPPVLMRRDEGFLAKRFSNTFTKVVDHCVHPNPSCRPSPTKLLSMSFLRSKKKFGVLKDLLKPVVPLDTSTLRPVREFMQSLLPVPVNELEQLSIEGPWTL
ncbi:STE20-related kinase adapter protein alpha-like [Halichondria panicea]|uniref:STE20-related kinase adapter protein alpha-like n=1 Tax=Halichondria panicea TaxID=6063 RepID=UPI00312B7162